MATVPPDEMRTKRGNLNTAGLILAALAIVAIAGWLCWAMLRSI